MDAMLKLKFQKAKVKHRCCWCDEWTEAGKHRWYRSYVFQGDFQQDYMHEECMYAMADSDRESLEDGWSPGQFKRGKTAEVSMGYESEVDDTEEVQQGPL